MKHQFFIILSFLMISTFLAFGSGNYQTEFEQGNKAFDSGDYATAIESYQTSLSIINGNSAAVQANLGNAFYKNKQLGKAILHWEKSLQLKNDKDVRKNLSIAQEEIKGDVIPVKPFFLVKWWKGIRSLFNSGIWGILSILILWIAAAGLIIWLFHKDRLWRKRGFIMAVSGILLCILPLIWAHSQAALEKNSKRAILTIGNTTLKTTPDGTGDFIIHEGTELELLDRVGDWHKVRLLNSDIGWVEDKDCEKI